MSIDSAEWGQLEHHRITIDVNFMETFAACVLSMSQNLNDLNGSWKDWVLSSLSFKWLVYSAYMIGTLEQMEVGKIEY